MTEILSVVDKFHVDGFVVIENVIEKGRIDDIRAESLNAFDDVMAIIRDRSLHFGIGIKNGFKEIVQRHRSRFEMPYRMDSPSIDEMIEQSSVRSIVQQLFGEQEIEVINKSLVLSLPQAEDQAWHSDGPHLSLNTHLPCHVLNVFVPLVDVTKDDGPTEFRPGSHYYTRDLAKEFLLAKLKKKLRPISGPCLQRGSILIFDYRVLHRGTANVTTRPRPFLVWTFARAGFRDLLNFPHRSVHDAVPVEKVDQDDQDDQDDPSSSRSVHNAVPDENPSLSPNPNPCVHNAVPDDLENQDSTKDNLRDHSKQDMNELSVYQDKN